MQDALNVKVLALDGGRNKPFARRTPKISSKLPRAAGDRK